MKNWKVIKKYSRTGYWYEIYHRKFFFFWKFMYSETPEEWSNRVCVINKEGLTLDEFCYTINF